MADVNRGEAIGWGDEGVAASSEFEVLPAGEYGYEVTGLTRERYDGGERMAPCPVAALQLRCEGEGGVSGTVFTRLYLNSKVMFRITNFLKSCGALPADTADGARFSMALFDQVVGRRGRCRLRVREYTARDGARRESNDVDFLVPDVAPAAGTPYGGSF